MSENGATNAFPVMETVFENTMDALQEVIQEADVFIEAQRVSPTLTYAIRLALEELGTNVIKYGYADKKCHRIAVSLLLAAPAVMTLTDDGQPFDPVAERPDPTLDGPIEDRPIGGLGLHMIQAMGMQLNYRREDGHNVLSVVFPET